MLGLLSFSSPVEDNNTSLRASSCATASIGCIQKGLHISNDVRCASMFSLLDSGAKFSGSQILDQLELHQSPSSCSDTESQPSFNGDTSLSYETEAVTSSGLKSSIFCNLFKLSLCGCVLQVQHCQELQY